MVDVAFEEAVDLANDSPAILRQRLERYLATNDDRKKETWLALQRRYAEERIRFRQACEDDPQVRALARAAVHSKDGFWFFCRTFGTIWEPRKRDTGRGYLPFIPFPHQEKAAQFFFGVYEDGAVGLNIKTRDMGISWMLYHMLAWLWLTDMEGFSVILGSRVEDLVDKSAGTLDEQTMFGRLEIIICHLPKWLLPAGFDLNDYNQRQKVWWRNPENGNTFIGQASTVGFGRQNRTTLAFGDEFEFWEKPSEALGALRDSAGATWLVTTPNKDGEQVARRIVDEQKARILELPWELHPYKTNQWFREEGKFRFDEHIATELQLSWDGNKSDLIYPEYDRCPKGDFPFRLDWPLYGGIDFGRRDGCGLVWLQRSPLSLRHRAIASHYRAGESLDFYLPFLGGQMVSGHDEYSQADLDLIDTVRAWYRAAQFGIEWYGDPAGRQTPLQANLSVIEALTKHHIYVTTNPRAVSHADRQAATRTVIRNMDVNKTLCAMLEWSAARYKRPPTAHTSTQRTIKPIHNRASHVMSALEYYAVNVPEAPPGASAHNRRRARHKAAWETA